MRQSATFTFKTLDPPTGLSVPQAEGLGGVDGDGHGVQEAVDNGEHSSAGTRGVYSKDEPTVD